MMIHFSIAKYNSLLVWKTYIHPGKGIAGEGFTPTESVESWLKNFREWSKSYESGMLSLGKFCENLGVSLEEGKQILRAENIALDLGISTNAELQEDIENA